MASRDARHCIPCRPRGCCSVIVTANGCACCSLWPQQEANGCACCSLWPQQAGRGGGPRAERATYQPTVGGPCVGPHLPRGLTWPHGSCIWAEHGPFPGSLRLLLSARVLLCSISGGCACIVVCPLAGPGGAVTLLISWRVCTSARPCVDHVHGSAFCLGHLCLFTVSHWVSSHACIGVPASEIASSRLSFVLVFETHARCAMRGSGCWAYVPPKYIVYMTYHHALRCLRGRSLTLPLQA